MSSVEGEFLNLSISFRAMVAQAVKNPLECRRPGFDLSLGCEDLLEKGILVF